MKVVKKKLFYALICALMCTGFTGCGSTSEAPVTLEKEVMESKEEGSQSSEEVESSEEGTVEEESSEEPASENPVEGESSEEPTAESPVEGESSEEPTSEENGSDAITDEQAVNAIRNYCCLENPDLESVGEDEYPVYWEVMSSDENEIAVVFRSYTGAQKRFYIDRSTGDTYVTEFVPGIMDEEERSEETLNVRDYFEN